MKLIKYVILFVFAAVLISACAQSPPEPVTYTIDMTEYSYTPDTIEAKVGQQVTLELVNHGALDHEIMFGRDVMMMDNRPTGYQHDMFEEAGVEPVVMMMESMEEGEHEEGDEHSEGEHEEESEHVEGDGHGEAEHEEGDGHQGFMVHLPKTDDRATMTFTVTEDMEGEWEIGCFLLDGVHYTAGMKGKFIVSP